MIHRIVKLSFNQNFHKELESSFSKIQKIVERQEGCKKVELLKGPHDLYFTLSTWNSEADLEKYRSSETFMQIWNSFKPNFSAKAEAWTTKKVDENP